MPEAISNTSPLLFLHRIDALDWLPNLFRKVWVPRAVRNELQIAHQKGYSVPDLKQYRWIKIAKSKSVPSEWLSLDLGKGELEVLTLGLEKRDCIVLLDDDLARRIGLAAGLRVWGTLRILLEAKSAGLIKSVKPVVRQLEDTGMWISDEIRTRILALADENEET